MLTIEIFGLSRTGKTSTLRNLEAHFGSQGQKCEVITRAPINFKDCSGLEDFHFRMASYFEQRIAEAQAKNPDYVLMDRGPYDREVMLRADNEDGELSASFYQQTSSRLERLQPLVDLPLLFMVEPATSLARIHSQRDEGLDYSYMCAGINTRDNMGELTKLFDRYAQFQIAKPEIIRVNAYGSKEETRILVLEKIASKRVKNDGSLGQI
ncbi:MAG: hypothetical protein AABW89_03325 [Nanoarchaeota archaeon]